jgi:hypothetical protein
MKKIDLAQLATVTGGTFLPKNFPGSLGSGQGDGSTGPFNPGGPICDPGPCRPSSDPFGRGQKA